MRAGRAQRNTGITDENYRCRWLMICPAPGPAALARRKSGGAAAGRFCLPLQHSGTFGLILTAASSRRAYRPQAAFRSSYVDSYGFGPLGPAVVYFVSAVVSF